MISIKSLITALAAFATISSVSATPTAAVEKRNNSPVALAITGDGACDQSYYFNQQVYPGECTGFGRNGYGARLQTGNEQCVFKFWANGDCTGSATTWYAPPNVDSTCIPIANNGGTFKLGGGARSVLVNCATDYVPHN